MYAVREPRAAGLFYNSDKNALLREIDVAFNGKDGPREIDSEEMFAAITPHDKYHLCGPVSAWAYAKMPKANYVIIGANHFDVGSRFAIAKEGLWKTPLGEVTVSSKVAQKMIDKAGMLDHDVTPHNNEHSVEVQLPFLQHRFGNDFKIVPIVIRNKFDDKDFVKHCDEIGKAIAQSVMSEKERWIVIGTTDFSHGPKEKVEMVDKTLLATLRTMNEKKFFDAVHRNESYICGYGAVLTTLSAAKHLGAKRGKVTRYANSMDVVGDPKSVAGYASMMFQ